MMTKDIFFNMIDNDRNIYEHSVLFNQCRKAPNEFLKYLANPYASSEGLQEEGDTLICKSSNMRFPISENVIDFRNKDEVKNRAEWERLNTQFLNYHKSLTVFTLLNSLPINHYVSIMSEMGALQNAKVVDVGAGTGHTFNSFFNFPESIEYYLVDPNLRLLHDHFLRVYPKLAQLPLSHLLAYAEYLPFRDGFADVVLSLSAIDHYNDYLAFFSEAHRILRPGGKVLISSHLDIPPAIADKGRKLSNWMSESFLERLTRYLYYRKNRLGKDDHTYHFKNIDIFVQGLEEKGFKILKAETFKRYFFVLAEK